MDSSTLKFKSSPEIEEGPIGLKNITRPLQEIITIFRNFKLKFPVNEEQLYPTS